MTDIPVLDAVYEQRYAAYQNRVIRDADHAVTDKKFDPLATTQAILPPALSGVSKNLTMVGEKLSTATGTAGFGNKFTFKLNRADMQFLRSLILEFTITESGAVATTIAPASCLFQSIKVKCGGVELFSKVTQNGYQLWFETHDKAEENTGHDQCHKNSGTALNSSSATFQLEIADKIAPWSSQLFPISPDVLSPDIIVECQMMAQADCVDGLGTLAVSNMYLIQRGWRDDKNVYIPWFRTKLAAGKNFPYPCRNIDDQEITLSGTSDTKHDLTFSNHNEIEEFQFTLTDSASYAGSSFNPTTDTNACATFYVKRGSGRVYPDLSNDESSQENLYWKRQEYGAYPTGRAYYRISFADWAIGNSDHADKHTVHWGQISNIDGSDIILHLDSSSIAANDRLTIAMIYRRILTLAPNKTYIVDE